jgi:predicted permease
MTLWFRVFAARCAASFRRRRADSEFGDEIEMHIQMLSERFERQGMRPEEAAAAARRQFGNPTLVAERWREARSFLSPAALWRDIRFGARQLQRNPLLTTVAIVSLALGIGANTAIFTVAKKVLLDTLPVERPSELRMLTWRSGHERPVPPVWGDISSTDDGGLTSNAFSYPVLEALRKRTDAFADLIAFKDITMTASADGHADAVAAEMISGDAFSALGVRSVLGRALTIDDDTPGRGPVAVISEGLWTERFGRAESVLGKVISLNGVPVTIVGVSPARFTGLQMGTVAQIYVPLTTQPLLVPRAQNGSVSLLDNPQSWWVVVLVRLRPDMAEARTQAEMDVTLRQAAMAMLPDAKGIEQLHLKLEPGARGLDSLQGEFARPSYVLLALSGLVLLLACANLANLLLARAASRQREMSTRLALGARRLHILRQVLAESLLLAGLGGVAGLVLGYLARNAIPRLLENPWQRATMRVDFDWKVLAFTASVSLGTGILFGLVPAWQATRADVNTAMKDAAHGTAGRQRMWLGKGLVIFQIALSAILLIGAGLFVRTLVNLSNRALGFRTDHILLFKLNPSRARYTNARMLTLYEQMEEKLAAVPGVRSVSMSNIAIIGDGHSGTTFHVSGQPVEKEPIRVQTNGVGVDFFSTMGIPILQGRSFNRHDTPSSPKVAVVNVALAKKFFPNQNPIGLTFETDAEDVEGTVEIVGIVPDTQYADLRSETPPTFYSPYGQNVDPGRRIVEIRTEADPASILSQARAVVASLDRDLPLIDPRTMTEQVRATMSDERIFAQLTSGFGVLALVLAAIGIYGIMAYTVARRTSEIGIRMALGARTGQVIRMVLREAWWMAVAGVVLGVTVALWLARFVGSMLYGLNAADPLTLAGAALLLAGIALVAAAGPARRAAHVDPVRALRHE